MGCADGRSACVGGLWGFDASEDAAVRGELEDPGSESLFAHLSLLFAAWGPPHRRETPRIRSQAEKHRETPRQQAEGRREKTRPSRNE